MISDFLAADPKEVNNRTRQHKQKVGIVQYVSKAETPRIIPQISQKLKISIPTTNKLLMELLEEGVLVEVGKKETSSGRRPVLYGLNKELFYSIGIDVQIHGVRMCLSNIDHEVLLMEEIADFELANTQICLNHLINLVNGFVSKLPINIENVIGIGVGMTGRINSLTGESYSYFNFLNEPLAKLLSYHWKTKVIIENDTRAIALAEQVMGSAESKKDALVVNVSRGLGMTVIANGKVVTGSHGFAGEFGHMQFGGKERLCICGKKNCLGTEVSGYALEVDFKEAEGEESTVKCVKGKEVNYRQILKGAITGDELSLRLIRNQAALLGKSLGNIINLLNPLVIIIAGAFAELGESYVEEVKMGVNASALVNPFKSCKIMCSTIRDAHVVSKGAAALVFKRYNLI